jgi:hypothetical protein
VIEYSDEDKTPWFPGTVAPVRDGVYEREYLDVTNAEEMARQRFSLFTADRYTGWSIGYPTPQLAADSDTVSLYKWGDTDFRWRGLASDPNAVTIAPEVHVVAHNVPGLALDSGEFIPAAELNKARVDEEEDLF